MDRAVSRLEKEVDIVEMIRSRRFLHLALERLFDKQTLQELRTLSKFELVEVVKKEKSKSKKALERSN